MFKTVVIDRFRGFKNFELRQLGQLNLFVGNNNSGKTSVLEAIQLLCSRKNLETLYESLERRGEFFWDDDNGPDRELDIRHLFYGHDIDINSSFSITGTNDNEKETLVVSIRSNDNPQNSISAQQLLIQEDLFNEGYLSEEGLRNPEIHFNWSTNLPVHVDGIKRPLTNQGGLSFNRLHTYNRMRNRLKETANTQFVTSSSLTSAKMKELFDQVVLTPEEKIIQDALKMIEPSIERIASVSTRRSRSEQRTGFVVRLVNDEQRVPIGSFGDGTWRMLGLALATTSVSNGFLFIDEIDTGLHYSVMGNMWKLIWETAKRLNVQVFATTHNSDCWTSLANVINEESSMNESISIHRIEKGKSSSTVFTEREIAIAVERGIEVR